MKPEEAKELADLFLAVSRGEQVQNKMFKCGSNWYECKPDKIFNRWLDKYCFRIVPTVKGITDERMTKEDSKKIANLLLAYARGETIRSRSGWGRWRNCDPESIYLRWFWLHEFKIKQTIHKGMPPKEVRRIGKIIKKEQI